MTKLIAFPEETGNGYRYYRRRGIVPIADDSYYKYLGFPLKEIKSPMKQDEDNLLPLKHQLNLMQKEKDRLLTLIDTLGKITASTKAK